MRALVLVNPAARGGAFADVGEGVRDRLTRAGWTCDLVIPVDVQATRAALRAAPGTFTAVIVAGGDGTVGLAVQELTGTDVTLGVIAIGTGNDFATTFGLPVSDPDASVELILSGSVRSVDFGVARTSDSAERPFATVLATGFDSLVNDRANRMRWPRGHARYTIAIFIEYVRLRRVAYSVTWTDAEGRPGSLTAPLLMASAANTRSYGGGIPIAPAADPHDGLLDLILVRPAGRLRLLRLLATVFRAEHADQPEVTIRRVREARLTAADVTAYADGDPVGVLPISVRAVPDALRIFAPPR
ncbi:diacylglycerol kinase family protein [Microbacterium gorillae]|uniref:diacylglycerol kinase family protein n=1 Tax=Microbacterium gorillae TaxID=1231063 RepID=UPI0005914C5B|nr:diacylglycerol kinase family protein [Microbacterium gorillae]